MAQKNSLQYKKEEILKNLIKLIVGVSIIILIFNIVNYKNIKTQLLKIFYKTYYSEYVEKYAEKYQVDKYLIYAIIKAESNFNENAVSKKGAQGLMQLMYSTADEIAAKIGIEVNEESILEPDVNINLGTKCLSILIQKYENNNLALAAYNAGSGNVDSWINDGILEKDGSNIENIPYLETNNYVRKILRDYEIYKQLYERPTL